MGIIYSDILSASLPATVVTSNFVSYPQIVLIAVYMKPVTTGLLSALTVTVRWNDGQARSHTEVCPLTSLGLFLGPVFSVLMAPTTDLTVEAVLTGLGTCQLYIGGFF